MSDFYMLEYHYGDIDTPETNEYDLLSFDFDDTLVPNGVTNTTYCIPPQIVFNRIREYVRSRTHAVAMCIFSNQYSLGKKKITLAEVTARFTEFEAALRKANTGVMSLYIYFAPEKNKYRKPFTGMYQQFILEIGREPVSKLYVGDAAGRESVTYTDFLGKRGKTSKDFACTDYHFARNCGMDFETPESFFLSMHTEGTYCKGHLPPPVILDNTYSEVIAELSVLLRTPGEKKAVILLIGQQGVGKSTFSSQFTGLATSFSLDDYTTFPRMRNAVLACNDNIIIDNTNPCVVSRARFLSLFKVTHNCWCVDFSSVPDNTANHARMMRIASGGKYIPEIAVRMFKTKYTPPTLAEGFTKIFKVSSVDIADSPYYNYEYII